MKINNLEVDFKRKFDYENQFYLSCDNTRLAKMAAQFELYKKILNLPGDIVECGVFKGTSLIRFATFRSLLGNVFSHKIIGFDYFDDFPEVNDGPDKKYYDNFIKSAGNKSITRENLMQILNRKGIDKNIELVAGDIFTTVPEYIQNSPHLKICLLNLDTDIYEPCKIILENFWEKIVNGGVLILDNYSVFPGETAAIDDFFKDKKVKILKFNYAATPCYIIKED